MRGVLGDKDSVLALLSCAAAPYLMMLGRWLWSGELLAEDDPHDEFPLRCRETLAGGARGSGEDGRKEKEPWLEDGGGSFMTLAFHENESAGVPCFLDDGVLAAAARAGKLLRMLKVSLSPGSARCWPFPITHCVFPSSKKKNQEVHARLLPPSLACRVLLFRTVL